MSRLALLDWGIRGFELQRDVRDAAGLFIGRADFLWDEQRLVGEADGLLKYNEPVRLVAEKMRQERLEHAGYRVVRWCWADLKNFGPVVERIQRALRGHTVHALSR